MNTTPAESSNTASSHLSYLLIFAPSPKKAPIPRGGYCHTTQLTNLVYIGNPGIRLEYLIYYMNLSPIQPVICMHHPRLSSLSDQLYIIAGLLLATTLSFFLLHCHYSQEGSRTALAQPPSLGAPRQEELIIWMVVHRLPTSLWDNSSCHG